MPASFMMLAHTESRIQVVGLEQDYIADLQNANTSLRGNMDTIQ